MTDADARRDALLATGPFPDALRAAIAARGLGVDRLRARLAEAGTPVSGATLSYWASGRSRPERRASMAALRSLERVLRVPDGALRALLGPSRRAKARPALAAYWPRPEQVADLVSDVDVRWDERLTRLSQHDRVVLGPEGGERAIVSRQVLRAEGDGPDRWVLIAHIDQHDRPLPTVVARRNCRLGRISARPALGLVAAELLFDRPLESGETVIIEHEVRGRTPYPIGTNYERKFRLGAREFVLEICFDPARLPARCLRFEQADGDPESAWEVAVGPRGTVHAVALNLRPGRFGFRWDWPAEAEATV
ncbi:hypothetical protein Afil01_64490 [Actinorhabdospora filicis]|uniref:Uncharacterized protein n=1 Tax=Actinorhabdospora filicis TaxID=1785913 RepID=A0A9W6SSS1_9ACTN|nr:hypothetical protein [Actinorhabdospora filicis]GLZ81642.1 hypothetical protein Afil01_64490 [Actinorhabdospora filicis]